VGNSSENSATVARQHQPSHAGIIPEPEANFPSAWISKACASLLAWHEQCIFNRRDRSKREKGRNKARMDGLNDEGNPRAEVARSDSRFNHKLWLSARRAPGKGE